MYFRNEYDQYEAAGLTYQSDDEIEITKYPPGYQLHEILHKQIDDVIRPFLILLSFCFPQIYPLPYRYSWL